MEIFSHTYATTYGRSYAVTDEEYLQESLEPQNRLTTRELNQLRAIREEIESRPRITRFEKRYIRVLQSAEEELCGFRPTHGTGILQIREILKYANRSTTVHSRDTAIAFLIASISRYLICGAKLETYSMNRVGEI